MPGFDKTGPGGQGAMTGRGQGPCVESEQYARPRFGDFRGFGRRWRNRFFASGVPGRFWGRGLNRNEPDNFSPQKKIEMLQDEANYLEKELNNIQEEIDKLKKDDKKVTTTENTE